MKQYDAVIKTALVHPEVRSPAISRDREVDGFGERVVAPLYITVQEAIRRWGAKRSKLYELLRTNQIASVKLGARTLIRTESGDAFFASLPPAFHS